MPYDQSLQWVESTGGPLILLEEAVLPYWHGCLSNSGSGVTDYERACAVSDYLGVIDVGIGSGLVLGEQPYSTTWWRSSEFSAGLLVRWVYAESEAVVLHALAALSTEVWETTDVELELANENLLLFDSASPGNDIDTFISIQLPKGRCVAETLHYVPDKQTSLLLHRFTLKPA